MALTKTNKILSIHGLASSLVMVTAAFAIAYSAYFGDVRLTHADTAKGNIPTGEGLTPSLPSGSKTPTPTATPTLTPTPTPGGGQALVLFAQQSYFEDESQTAMIEVRRIFTVTNTSIVQLAALNGTAVGGAVCDGIADFITETETIVFGPGETVKFASVQLCSDARREGDETIQLQLTGNDTRPGLAEAVLAINNTASTYRNTTPIQFGSATGRVDGTMLYPSTINVTNGPLQLSGIRVTLFDLWHNFPDNIDVLLVGPAGQKYVLMGDSGGSNAISSAMPVTLSFGDVIPRVLPNSLPLTTGTSEPTTWESPVTSFPAPAPAAPYAEPGSVPGGPIETTMFGTFAGTDANGPWNLYVRDDQGALTAITGAIAGGWGIDFSGSTVSVSGRVLTAGGLGIRNADVVAIDEIQIYTNTTTSSFGYFTFEGLSIGQTYEFRVFSRRFRFQVPAGLVGVAHSIDDLVFVADP